MTAWRSSRLLALGAIAATVGAGAVWLLAPAPRTIAAIVVGLLTATLAAAVDLRLSLARVGRTLVRHHISAAERADRLLSKLGAVSQHVEVAQKRLQTLDTTLATVQARTEALSIEVTSAPWLPDFDETLRGRLEFLIEHQARLPATSELERLLERALVTAHRQTEATIGLDRLLGPAYPVVGSGGWAASADYLARLVTEIAQRRPSTVLECGSGLSTLWAAMALARTSTGQLWSLEHDAGYAAATQRLLDQHGLSRVATVVTTPLIPTETPLGEMAWYDLTGIPNDLRIDLLSIDGPPEGTQPRARYPAVPLLRDRLTSDALIMLDDVRRQDEQWALRAWAAELDAEADVDLGYAKGFGMIDLARRSGGDKPTPAGGSGDGDTEPE
jgi:predicted O-methyltransferase YrrM